MMRRILMFGILALLARCSTAQRPTGDRLMGDLESRARRLVAGGDIRPAVRAFTAGETGFYYLVSSEGTVLAHPNNLLEGSSFARYPFMKPILEKRRGCLVFSAGSMEQAIYYTRVNDQWILCATLPRAEITGPVNCEIMQGGAGSPDPGKSGTPDVTIIESKETVHEDTDR